VHTISAASGDGTTKLCKDMQARLDSIMQIEHEQPELLQEKRELQRKVQQEAQECIETLRDKRQQQKLHKDNLNDDDGAEFEYAP
jgi:putative protein kinase ArgK-like GTPase of G3E family